MEQNSSSQRERPSAREWVVAAVVAIAVIAFMAILGLAAVEATEAVGDRIEQVLYLLDHAERQAREGGR